MELDKFTFKPLNKVAVLNNLPSWIRICILNADPDPGGKINADPDPHIECRSESRRENECGSGSTALLLLILLVKKASLQQGRYSIYQIKML